MARCTATITGDKGKFEMVYVNLAAFLCAAALSARHFFNCIRLLAAIDGVIQLVFYDDVIGRAREQVPSRYGAGTPSIWDYCT